MGKMLTKAQIDAESGIVWIAISWEELQNYPEEFNLEAIDILIQSVKGTKFGVRMIEQEKGVVRVSFRGRTNIDTSEIAKELGGGGHKAASGAQIVGMEFDQAVEMVLNIARKYAK
jgi:phosphoesterase RecJ-like protein